MQVHFGPHEPRDQALLGEVALREGRLEQPQRVPLRPDDARLPQGVDHGVVDDGIGLAPLRHHSLKRLDGEAPLPALLHGGDEGRVGHHVGGAVARLHLVKDRLGLLPLPTLPERRDERVERHRVRVALLAAHLLEELEGELPLAGLLARRDERRVRDDVLLTSPARHLLEDLHDLVQLSALSVGRDEGVVGRRVGREAVAHHPLVGQDRLPGLIAHVACDQQRVVRPEDRFNTLGPHDVQDPGGLLPGTRLAVDVDQRVEGDDVRDAPLPPHGLVRLQRRTVPRALDANVHQRGKGMHVALDPPVLHLLGKAERTFHVVRGDTQADRRRVGEHVEQQCVVRQANRVEELDGTVGHAHAGQLLEQPGEVPTVDPAHQREHVVAHALVIRQLTKHTDRLLHDTAALRGTTVRVATGTPAATPAASVPPTAAPVAVVVRRVRALAKP